MVDKIKVEKPLVILHGDEMAQVAFERILEQFVTASWILRCLKSTCQPSIVCLPTAKQCAMRLAR